MFRYIVPKRIYTVTMCININDEIDGMVTKYNSRKPAQDMPISGLEICALLYIYWIKRPRALYDFISSFFLSISLATIVVSFCHIHFIHKLKVTMLNLFFHFSKAILSVTLFEFKMPFRL